MNIDFTQLGFTQEELQNRVVQTISDRILSTVGYDDDGDETTTDSRFAKTIEKKCREHIDTVINKIAEKQLLPNVASFIENLCLEETTRWGEKKGEKLTFIEYLVKRADFYLREQVNYEGKGKDEMNGYSFDGKQSRLTHIVHKHLQYSIESAMRDAVKNVNDAIVPALTDTVKIKLGEIANGLKVEVKAK